MLNNKNPHNIKLNTILVLLIIAIFSFDLLVPLGVAGGVPYITVILISLWHPKHKTTIYLAIICTFLTIAGFYLSPHGGELWKVIFNRVLALFAIWVTAILAMNWKQHKDEISSLNQKIEKEKEMIYLATINGAQHITNNLLNQLQYIELEIKSHPELKKDISIMLSDILSEAKILINNLSSVENIEDESIRRSIYPKAIKQEEIKKENK